MKIVEGSERGLMDGYLDMDNLNSVTSHLRKKTRAYGGS